MIIETSWDDESPLNLRVAQLLLKYKLPGIFFIPAAGYDLYNLRKLMGMGFEIGCHSMTHPQDIKRLSYGDKQKEIINSKYILERVIGKPIRHFCYPRGRYDEECVKLVREAGYETARTVKVLEVDYGEIQKRPLEKATTIHFFDRKEYKGVPPELVAIRYFEKAMSNCDCKNDSYFHLWGHAWEIEKYNNWAKLERTFEYIYNRMRGGD